MKVISVHVAEDAYEGLKALAGRRGQPVAALVRAAMSTYLLQEREQGLSVLTFSAHDSGPLLVPWSRAELQDEMIAR